MSGTKIAIVVLVVIVLLFVGMIVYGDLIGNMHPESQTNKEAATDFPNKKHSVLESLNGVLGPHAPKLKLSQSRFDLSHLSMGGTLMVDAPRDEGHDYRKASFRPTPNTCVKIDYSDKGPGPALQHQSWPAEGSKLDEANFTVSSEGGQFTFTPLAISQPCVVELE